MPTKDKDDKPAVEHSAVHDVMEDKGVFEQRRKLIKASAVAIPAIMTIRSGAAVALTSINQCLASDARKAAEDPPVLVLGKKDPLDEWVRVQGVKIKMPNAGGSGSTVYYCVEKSPGVWEGWDENGVPATQTIERRQIKKGKKVRLLGYVDSATGNYTMYPKQLVVSDQTASPLSYSCLCSLHPEMDICDWG